MIRIPAVSNATLGDPAIGDNPLHKVSLSAYYIGETELTQKLWSAVMGSNPSAFNGSAGKEAQAGELQVNRPVESGTRLLYMAFCNALTKKIRGNASECVYYSDAALSALYTEADAAALKLPFANWTKKGFRLPTNAEWEYAARGGTADKYAGTNDSAQYGDYAWYQDNSNARTHEVAKKKANGYGLYDMCGNVWEWCWDTCAPIAENSDLGKDPVGPAGTAADYYWIRSSDYGMAPWTVTATGCNTNGSTFAYNGMRLALRP